MLRRALSCIIDDVNGSIDSKFQCEIIKYLRRSYLKEVYYFLDKQNATIELVLKCLQKSNVFWHSLCVLTNVKLKNKKIELDEIKEICLHAKIILVGAYDGEGYIIWEVSN